ncbi:hypothetical protein evm_000815 [Chilo suppressalis]|nr:hypothetical protein evm_000815 [Chilo suppressalis]
MEMEEVRQLVQEEGREARNLIAFHVAVDTPARISRKPPRCLGGPVIRRAPPRAARRSASAGRDKRSELRARYWALLFGDLQRAIGEIYNTVEAHENLNECQEVILVLENYTRDFKALGEWFRLKWEYDNTPPPQRPQSLAWEIRKTDFVRPESRRAHSVKSSPSVSGKNSPCFSGHNTPSGKNSPNLTGKASPGSGKISPRVSSSHSSTSPKANIEFFSSKISASKVTAKPEPKLVKETSRLSDITEKEIKECCEEIVDNQQPKNDVNEDAKVASEIEIGTAKECPQASPQQVVIKSTKHSKKDAENTVNGPDTVSNSVSHAQDITAKLDAMESDFINKQLSQNIIKNENMLNHDKDIERAIEKNNVDISNSLETSETKAEKGQEKSAETGDKESNTSESPTKSEDNFADISNESSKFTEGKISDVKHYLSDQIEVPKSKPIQTSKESIKNISQESKEQSSNDGNTNKNNFSKDLKHAESNDDKDDSKKDIDIKKDNCVIKDKANPEAKPNVRPAYSQAAAKPKPATPAKSEVRTPTKTTLIRSKTVVEIRPSSAPKQQRQFPKKNLVNKCSYPFNLTTGRTSLFDSSTTQNKNVQVKKTINKNIQMAAGDCKSSQTKLDTKKHPPRPTTLKVNDKVSSKDKLKPSLENIKDCEEYSSTDTIVTQIDMSRIESSESLKTLVPDDLQMMQDVANSIEVLNVDNNKSDNEGWLTVKSRRLSRESKKQSKSHWSQRFHQPSATTSLPTLNMLESPKQESKPIVDSPKHAKSDRAKSEQPQVTAVPVKTDTLDAFKEVNNAEQLDEPVKLIKSEKPEKTVKVSGSIALKAKTKDPSMIRQKSDVTGLKTRSSRTKALKKSEKQKGGKLANEDSSDLTKNRLHSSLESLTTGLARSQESTEDAFDFDKWKAEFKSTFKYLDDDDQIILNHDEILESADPSERSEIAEMTSQIEENEKKLGWALDFQSEVDQRKLSEEEDLLNRQIMELQQVSDVELDTETDDTETDAEILCEDPVRVDVCTGTLVASLEDRYETALAGMSWAERVDTLGVLEALVARDPGRAQQLHAKLSQGIKRRGSLQDALRRLQAKQARAERQRTEYQTERARKIHQLLARVEEVKIAKNQLIEEKRLRMEKRLQKAAENRDQHLKDIVRKAHDEEEKLREIAFIKQLEAENRRHDFLDQCRSHTTRLRQMRRERLTKLEQKAAREAAVGARRMALEAARRRRVEALLERRRLRDARRDTLDQIRRQERHDAAREKAEGVKSRLSALAAAAELEADALRSRIRDKQDASQQRLESHLQAIREKATGPRQATTSESQDQGSKEERELAEQAERLEQERRDRERQKAVKKKARKLKQKLLATSNEVSFDDAPNTLDYLAFPPSSKLYKVLNSLSNIITPLLEPERDDKRPEVHQNGIEIDETEKNNKKNKKMNKTKSVNGDLDENSDKKRNKKKKDSDRLLDSIENNNNTQPEIIDDDKELKPDNIKKKKKNKCDNKNGDRPKLSKTNSVCSSLSDMSKCSVKSERRSKVVIDVPILERQLNELYRIMERFDKSSVETAMFHKLHGLRLLGQLLAVAAEREDIAPQFNAKLLITAVTTLIRVAAVSPAPLLATDACVHLVKLLADRLVLVKLSEYRDDGEL